MFYARYAIVLRNRIAIVLRTICDCFTHDVRVFVRRGRGGAKGRGVSHRDRYVDSLIHCIFKFYFMSYRARKPYTKVGLSFGRFAQY